MNLNLLKLMNVIEECNKHLVRIFSAYVELKKIIPLDEKKFNNLNDYEVRLLDQFVFRFSKLQDAMGQRLFTALLLSLEEDVKTIPFIDILNKLEELGLIESKENWLLLRKLRNVFSHEYANETKENADAINLLFEQLPFVYNTFQRIKEYSIAKFIELGNNALRFNTPSFPADL